MRGLLAHLCLVLLSSSLCTCLQRQRPSTLGPSRLFLFFSFEGTFDARRRRDLEKVMYAVLFSSFPPLLSCVLVSLLTEMSSRVLLSLVGQGRVDNAKKKCQHTFSHVSRTTMHHYGMNIVDITRIERNKQIVPLACPLFVFQDDHYD